MESKQSAIRVEIKNPEDEAFMKKLKEDARVKTGEELKKGDSFVLVTVDEKGVDVCITSTVKGDVVPQIIDAMGRIMKQYVDETFKSENMGIIMRLIAVIEKENGRRKEGECECEQCKILRKEQKDGS